MKAGPALAMDQRFDVLFVVDDDNHQTHFKSLSAPTTHFHSTVPNKNAENLVKLDFLSSV